MSRERKNDGIAAEVAAMSIFGICALILSEPEINYYSVKLNEERSEVKEYKETEKEGYDVGRIGVGWWIMIGIFIIIGILVLVGAIYAICSDNNCFRCLWDRGGLRREREAKAAAARAEVARRENARPAKPFV